MLLDQVTDSQMQAAGILTGATMAAFLAAPMVRGRTRLIQLVVAGLYFAGVLGFLLYFLV